MKNLEHFVTSKLAAGLSGTTIDWYEWIVNRYRAWCEAEGHDWQQSATVERYLADQRRRGLSPVTVNGHYRALRVWFRWLVERRLLQPGANPIDTVAEPRMPRRRPRYVTVDEFRRLYDSIQGDRWVDARDRAILLILFFSGLRVGELLNLQSVDIDMAQRLIIVNAGKGGHARHVPCTPALGPELGAYLRLCPAACGSALWLSDDGAGGVRGALSIEGVRQMLRRRCKREGMRNLNPHAFRHGYAMALLNAGMDLSALSAAMGHTSVKTTEQTYAHWLTGGIQREYAAALARLTRA